VRAAGDDGVRRAAHAGVDLLVRTQTRLNCHGRPAPARGSRRADHVMVAGPSRPPDPPGRVITSRAGARSTGGRARVPRAHECSTGPGRILVVGQATRSRDAPGTGQWTGSAEGHGEARRPRRAPSRGSPAMDGAPPGLVHRLETKGTSGAHRDREDRRGPTRFSRAPFRTRSPRIPRPGGRRGLGGAR